MGDKKEFQHWSMDKAIRYIYINEIIFVLLVFLCFIGELLAEFTDRVALFYWFFMTPVFFYCSILSEKAKAISTGVEIKHLLRYELLCWGSVMAAVLLIFLMWHAETLKPGAAAMSIHIILAHTMFVSGVILGVYYYLVGAILFLTAALSILFGGTFGLDLVLAIPFIWLGLYYEKKLIFPTLKRKNDFMKELDKKRQDENPKQSD